MHLQIIRNWIHVERNKRKCDRIDIYCASRPQGTRSESKLVIFKGWIPAWVVNLGATEQAMNVWRVKEFFEAKNKEAEKSAKE